MPTMPERGTEGTKTELAGILPRRGKAAQL